MTVSAPDLSIPLINGGFLHANLIVQAVINGLSNGALYALMALTVVVIFRTTGHLNIAQGELATLSALLVFSLSVSLGWAIWLAIPVVAIISFFIGAGVERFLVRPVEQRSTVAVLMVGLGLFLIVNALDATIWGVEQRPALAPFPAGPDTLYVLATGTPNIVISASAVLTVVTLLVIVAGLWALLHRTRIGLAYRAVAANRQSATLSGLPVSKMLMFGWALASAIGAFAGVITSQQASALDFNLMASVLLYGFAAAALGGFDSILGAVLGGVTVGVAEAIVPNLFSFLGPALGLSTALMVIVVVLLVRPSGMFGSRKVQRA